MEQFKIEKAPSLPDRVYRKILELIQTNQYKIGEKLPSEKKFSERLGVSRTALREALQKLEMDGYVDRRHGVGTFVIAKGPSFSAGLEQLESMTALIKEKGLVPGTRNIGFKKESVSEKVAKYLELPKGKIINLYERIRTADGKPFAYDIVIASDGVIDQDFVTDQNKESIFMYLEHKKSTYLTHSYCNIYPENASSELAKKLDVPHGDALQVLEQVYYAKGNKPIFYGKSYLRKDIVQFHLLRRRY